MQCGEGGRRRKMIERRIREWCSPFDAGIRLTRELEAAEAEAEAAAEARRRRNAAFWAFGCIRRGFEKK